MLDQQRSSEFLTPPELATLIRVSRATLERLIAQGDLAFYRFGRQRRFRRDDVEVWISKQWDSGWRNQMQ
ncbi:DNA-binding protein [Patescibacteria group bacterium]|nr:MAG: DNA-binding protein [Patescibacteria group bacterium]